MRNSGYWEDFNSGYWENLNPIELSKIFKQIRFLDTTVQEIVLVTLRINEKIKSNSHKINNTYIRKNAQMRIPVEYAILSLVGCCLSLLSSIEPPHFPLQRQQQNTRPTMGITIAAIRENDPITIIGTS